MAITSTWLESPAPGKMDITICRGRTFQRSWQLLDGPNQSGVAPTVLAGCTVLAQVRRPDDVMILDLGATVFDPINGWIRLHVSPAQTSLLVFPANGRADDVRPCLGRWDVQVTDANGDTVTPLAGLVYVQWNEARP
jgi:hypothetical protein